jgi:glucose/arabinose dehydrogenase
MRFILIFLLSVISCGLFAQQSNGSVVPDSRLNKLYSTAQLEEMVVKNPFMIQRYNYYLDHAWRVVDLPADKASSASRYNKVVIEDLGNINILALIKDQKLKKSMDGPVYYLIEGTNKLLMIDGEKEFTKKLNKALGRTRN